MKSAPRWRPNIFVNSTPAQNFTQSATGPVFNVFEDSQPAGASNPYLVNWGDRLLLAWEAQGELQVRFWMAPENWWGISTMAAADCPIVSRHIEGSVWWYCTAKSGPVFLPAGPQNRWTECLNGSVSVTLDPNGGTVSPSMVSVTYGASYGLPDPVRLTTPCRLVPGPSCGTKPG